MFQLIQLLGGEWLCPALWNVSGTPLHANGVLFNDLVLDANREDSMQNRCVERKTRSATGEVPCANPSGSPNFEGLDERLADVLQKSDFSFFQKSLELVGGVAVSLRSRITEFVKRNASMQFVLEGCTQICPGRLRFDHGFLVAGYFSEYTKRRLRKESLQFRPEA